MNNNSLGHRNLRDETYALTHACCKQTCTYIPECIIDCSRGEADLFHLILIFFVVKEGDGRVGIREARE